MTTDTLPRLQVTGADGVRYDEILTLEALGFVAELHEQFAQRRAELLQRRKDARERGRRFDFPAETAAIRADTSWRVAPPAPGLEDRRCEITGPPTKRMTINALNSGARVWMADFEDATAPTWANVVEGQLNLHDAIRRRIDFTTPDGRTYALNETTATIMVRPRGWHLTEQHLVADGRGIAGSLVDFGLYFFHNAAELIARGRGPYFYLPKLESHLEARLWHDVFAWSEQRLGIEPGSIRATCLLETFPAAFEMTEILYELRDYSAGLNAGRWDYIFSFIKNHADQPDRVLPDRDRVTMTVPFMRAYTELLVKTCHERGAHAIGGMAAFVPSASDPEATARALHKTRADKAREASDGFDGSWVAHPGLVATCTEVFDEALGERPHQLDRQRPDVDVTADRLADLTGVERTVTLGGVRTNLRVPLAYLTAWLGGQGAVAIEHLMEDAATVEISRMQLWQWIRHWVTTPDGVTITGELVASMLDEEARRLCEQLPAEQHDRVATAREILEEGCLGADFPTFVTLYGYTHFLVERSGR